MEKQIIFSTPRSRKAIYTLVQDGRYYVAGLDVSQWSSDPMNAKLMTFGQASRLAGFKRAAGRSSKFANVVAVIVRIGELA